MALMDKPEQPSFDPLELHPIPEDFKLEDQLRIRLFRDGVDKMHPEQMSVMLKNLATTMLKMENINKQLMYKQLKMDEFNQ